MSTPHHSTIERVKHFIAKRAQAPAKPRRPRNVWSRRFFYLLVVLLAVFSYLTNPFVRFTLVVDPYNEIEEVEGGQLKLKENASLILRQDAFFSHLAYVKSGWYILSSKFVGGHKTSTTNVDEIIGEIHALRFNPDLPFLISGDHFSVLYLRSLGIFYHSVLDPRTALSDTNWRNRQLITLKTTAYALQVFAQAERLSTTIVPVGPRSVALVNIYAPPSDSLYSLLYALDTMVSSDEILTRYPYGSPEERAAQRSLSISTAATELKAQYQESLQGHFNRYWEQVYDPATGLVRTDILLSGTKDIARRQGAFYDNVIAWKTHALAQKLGLIPAQPAFLAEYKTRILDTYWVEEEGLFLEDLSQESIENNWYSSDWLIAFQTGFLDAANEKDRVYLIAAVDYIQRNAIDQPFGLQYHSDKRLHRLYTMVRWTSPEYGSTVIWSNWGMEYTKLLIRLAQVTGDETYLQQAGRQLETYTYNIKRYRGYPEVYRDNGDFYRSLWYKSIRRTGWVVTYQQAREMYEWTREEMNQKPAQVPTQSLITPL